MRTLTAILFCLVMISCGPNENQKTGAVKEAKQNQRIQVKSADFVDTISYHLLCKPIDTLDKMFAVVKDSVFESEGVEWPGKIVYHTDSSWTIFETSWTDKKNIWRVTTTSRAVKFQAPYQVGSKISEIQKDGYAFTFNEGDGGEYYYFTNERLRHLGFRIEDQYSSEFYKNAYEKGLEDPLKYLNPMATITELIISGGCSDKNIGK